MLSFFPQWIQDINTGLSIIGFGITLFVLFEVKSIKNTFLSKARLPELINELSRTGSVLNGNLGEWPQGRNEAHCQIKIAASLIKSASKMVPPEDKKELLLVHKKLLTATQNFFGSDYSKVETVWDLYSDIQYSITCIKQVSKNSQWG